jgi:hypothetical protein
MKKSHLFAGVLSIIAFASVSHAQHVKVFDGRDARTPAIFRNVGGSWVQLSSDVAVGPSAVAGQTIRLRIAATNNRGRLLVGVDDVDIPARSPGGKLYVATNVGVYQVPCEGSATRSGGVPGAQLTLNGTSSDATPSWKTEKDWRGTCRMLVVKLRDGNEVRARIRFE